VSETLYLWVVILAMTGATFLTRLLPFLLFRNRAEHPLLIYLGRYLPPAIMTILVLYSLQGVALFVPPFGARELIAVLVTLALHRWRGNPLLSIFAGTACYMAMIQTGTLT
jgi:branched-subunit amino acid transport protein AzlD